VAANSQVYDNTAFGITLFTLRPHSYTWRFDREQVAGNGTLTDQGSARCNADPDPGDGDQGNAQVQRQTAARVGGRSTRPSSLRSRAVSGSE
jgi:hypothetical protein